MRDCARRLAAAAHNLPHPEERALARVSKDGARSPYMVRDGAEPVIGPRFARTRWRLLTMRESSATASEGFAVWAGAERPCRGLRSRHHRA
jgi:hypothetical protein